VERLREGLATIKETPVAPWIHVQGAGTFVCRSPAPRHTGPQCGVEVRPAGTQQVHLRAHTDRRHALAPPVAGTPSERQRPGAGRTSSGCTGPAALNPLQQLHPRDAAPPLPLSPPPTLTSPFSILVYASLAYEMSITLERLEVVGGGDIAGWGGCWGLQVVGVVGAGATLVNIGTGWEAGWTGSDAVCRANNVQSCCVPRERATRAPATAAHTTAARGSMPTAPPQSIELPRAPKGPRLQKMAASSAPLRAGSSWG
jgi:hypothetical protein